MRILLALAGVTPVIILVAAGLAWADHELGPRPGALNPWVEALLWGSLGLAVAMIVVITVTIFTRAPAEHEEAERHSR